MIDPKHPRYQSLLIREKLTSAFKRGITSPAGLIAHGRGEAFDYLLGEKTGAFAHEAIKAAAATLILSKKAVLSVNGNAAALAGQSMILIAKTLNCPLEVNLYHHSLKRVEAIEDLLQKKAGSHLLKFSKYKKMVIPGIASKRKITLREGIGSADCIFIPLEDGDRSHALKQLGKRVITVDLNPLSRTAQAADITIIDNIVRCLPLLLNNIRKMRNYPKENLEKTVKGYDNRKIIRQALKVICYHNL